MQANPATCDHILIGESDLSNVSHVNHARTVMCPLSNNIVQLLNMLDHSSNITCHIKHFNVVPLKY